MGGGVQESWFLSLLEPAEGGGVPSATNSPLMGGGCRSRRNPAMEVSVLVAKKRRLCWFCFSSAIVVAVE